MITFETKEWQVYKIWAHFNKMNEKYQLWKIYLLVKINYPGFIARIWFWWEYFKIRRKQNKNWKAWHHLEVCICVQETKKNLIFILTTFSTRKTYKHQRNFGIHGFLHIHIKVFVKCIARFICSKSPNIVSFKIQLFIWSIQAWKTKKSLISSIFYKCPDRVIRRFTVKPYILWKSLFHWICSKLCMFQHGHNCFDLWPHEGC